MSKVERQRSMEFNLGLDINSLRQEVLNLMQLREMLATKALVARTSPTGSLMRMVREFYALFQRTVRQPQAHGGTGRSLVEFLVAMMIDDVDCYNGCTGRDTILTQYRRFSDYMGFLSMGMDRYTISTCSGTDDEVVISTGGILNTRVTRETLTALFPHILAHEELCSQLIGQSIGFPCTVEFIFNGDAKVCVFRVDIDFVAGLSATLSPDVIALMLDNARISHSMLCIDDELIGDVIGSSPGAVTEDMDEDEEEDQLMKTQLAQLLGSNPMGELPSLFAHDDELNDDEAAFTMCVDTIVLPIDIAELFDF